MQVIELGKLNHSRKLQRAAIAVVIAAGVNAGIGSASLAADLPAAPVYKTAPVVGESGWYAFEDGMYERVRLPSFALGFHNASSSIVDLGPVSSFDPRLQGGGARGGLGYQVHGSQLRFELGGSYVKAGDTQTRGGAESFPGAAPVLLNGTVGGGAPSFCIGRNNVSVSCATTGTLRDNYDSWQVDGKIAYDMQWLGAVSVSPFAALFGGSSRNNQEFGQSRTATVGGVVANTDTYAASTSLTWNDFGGRIGLEAAAPVTDWVTWSFTGSVGVVDRMVSLTGSDVATLTALGATNSAISSTGTTAAVRANVESGFAVRPLPSVTLRAFGGANFDSRVPGISSPSFAPGLAGATPAAINYSQETSYYAGGGVVVKF